MIDKNSHYREIHEWLLENTPLISLLLSKERENQIQKHSANEQTDLTLRLLSEMPLCLALIKIPAPHGYELEMKTVTYPNRYETATSTTSELHYCFQSTDVPRTIICLTAGQFVHSRNFIFPGDRRKQLIARAPELIHIVNDQIFAVVGKDSEIETRLHLRY